MSIMLIPIIISIAFLFRIGMILMGLLKGPILHTFEKYGDRENTYYPLPSILLWGGVLLISLTALLTETASVRLNTSLPGALLLIAAYFAYTHPEVARQYPQFFMIYPRWYYDLRDRTSRYERRRLSYMWLWLPRRLRLAYNGSDRAFNQWADLVIIATMRFDDEDPTIWRDMPPPEQY